MATAKVKEEKVKVSRTLLLTMTDGELRITLPPGARVTFGPTIPFQKPTSGYENRNTEYSLRVYETAKNDSLVAVYAGVRSFRDVAIPQEKLVIREAGQSIWKSDESGYKTETSVEYQREWVEPFKKLEGGGL